jgi:hypothetical protein
VKSEVEFDFAGSNAQWLRNPIGFSSFLGSISLPTIPRSPIVTSGKNCISQLLTRTFGTSQMIASQGFGQVLDSGNLFFVTKDSSPRRALHLDLTSCQLVAALSAGTTTPANVNSALNLACQL